MRLTAQRRAQKTARQNAQRRVPRSSRTGTTLVELLIALPLLALVGAVALMLLLSAQRETQHTDRQLTNSHELRQAQSILESEFRALAPPDIIAWTDTSIDIESTIGVGVACNGKGPRDRIDLLPEHTLDPLRTSWSASPQADDIVRVFLDSGTSIAPRPFRATVRSLVASHACAGSPLVDSSTDRNAATRTILLRATLPAVPHAGTPVHLSRLVRYSIYASGGEWFLGRKERSSAGWDIVQPVAGPLLAPSAHGLLLEVRDANEQPVASADTAARLIHIELRAPARQVAAANGTRRIITDSAMLDVALRAAINIGGNVARVP
jgi:type II secretory pathway pseudopilin PulG